MAALEILYYGRLRDAIGLDREAVDLPSHVITVDDLVGWLRGRGEPHASALAGGGILASVGDDWVKSGESLFGAVEVALLPPVGVL